MKYFLMKLYGPRATFPADITPEEREMMTRHSVYWTGQIKQGKAIVIGPVADPNGMWGMGVLRVGDAAEAELLMKNDPAILANAGFRNEMFVMPNLLLPEGV